MRTRPQFRSWPALFALYFSLGFLAAQATQANRFEEDIQAFEQQDRLAFPKTGQILFLGSSSIRLWDLHRHFPGLDAINRGFGGSEISDSIYFRDRIVIPYRPRIIVFYAGDNDIANGKTAEQVAKDFHYFTQYIHRALPSTRIIYIAIKPSPKRWALVAEMRKANQLIRRQARQTNFIKYLDVDTPMIGPDKKPKSELFAEDKLHLNEDGYALWTQLLKPLLK